MNLKDLTQEVNSALDYNPDLAAYKNQVARVINRHYLQISSQYPWLFRQKTSKLTLRADIAGSSTNLLRVGIDDRTYDSSNVLTFTGTGDALPTREMMGNTLVIGESDSFTTTHRLSTGHGSSEREFTITGIWDALGGTDGLGYDYGGGPGESWPTDDDDNDLKYMGNRYGGSDSDEWPDGYVPTDNGGIVVDRPIVSPSTVTQVATSSSEALVTVDPYTDWKIEFRQYYLPSDCIEVLGMMDRGLKTPVSSQSSSTISTSIKTAPDRGRIIFLDSSKEEHLFLDRDSSGDPVVAIEGMPVHSEAPMLAPLVDVFNEIDWKTKTGVTGHSPNLYPEYTYEYCYTFLYAGVESPPSPVTRITMSNDADKYGTRLIFQSIEGVFRRKNSRGPTDADHFDSALEEDTTRAELDADITHRMTGRVIRIYRRNVNSSGDQKSRRYQGSQRWLHIGDHFTDEPAWDIGRSQSDWNSETETAKGYPHEYGNGTSAIVGWPELFWMEQGRWTYHDGELSKVKVLDESGPRQTIRVYRPPSQDMDIEIRYLSRPRRLVADADTPEWPVQYHHLLVYMTLSDICLQHGISGQSQLYERKAEDLLDRMKQKYLARTNRKYVRGSFDKTLFAGERWGTPSKIG
jgi:hypothetical protein